MFESVFDTYNWEEVRQSILSKTETDVRMALNREKRTLDDFKALISPAARYFLEEMALLGRQLTMKRFGKVIQMYVPMYLSNECQNICTYCAFSYDNKITRKTLTDEEILREVKFIKEQGYDHILLVTGEANQTVGAEYLVHAVQLIKPFFSHISIEVQPMETHEYKILANAGVNAVLVYQETYHREHYKYHHPKGRKSNFEYRLNTPDRLGRAGVHKIGLGSLIGLEDWRTDSFFTALHLDHLERNYWKTKYSISFPRLRPIELSSSALTSYKIVETFMSDRELAQLICAFRIFNEEVELSLSTRESEKFRDHIIKLGITSMSAGSKTNPGGYVVEPGSLEQFEISDERSTGEVAEMIKRNGYEVVWKDWQGDW